MTDWENPRCLNVQSYHEFFFKESKVLCLVLSLLLLDNPQAILKNFSSAVLRKNLWQMSIPYMYFLGSWLKDVWWAPRHRWLIWENIQQDVQIPTEIFQKTKDSTCESHAVGWIRIWSWSGGMAVTVLCASGCAWHSFYVLVFIHENTTFKDNWNNVKVFTNIHS